MNLAVRKVKPGEPTGSSVTNEPRSGRISADMALFGIYEISKILNTPMRLEVMLGNVVNILTSFLLMRRGMIVVVDADGEPEIVATAGWAGEAKDRPRDSLPQKVIDRIVAGEKRAANAALLHELCALMTDGSLCAMGGMTPMPVLSALRHFPADFGLDDPQEPQ